MWSMRVSMMNGSNKAVSSRNKAANAGKTPFFLLFRGPLIIVLSGLFILATGVGCFVILQHMIHVIYYQKDGFRNLDDSSNTRDCDIFDGKWVLDDSYPLYNASECPFIEKGFNCLDNGRMEDDYLKWRWKPNKCDIPRVNMSLVLETLQNKRVVFVGDSMSRTQWESMICLLMSGLDDKESVYEVNQSVITKDIRFLGVRFSYFNLTIEFYRSVFLVQVNEAPKDVPKEVRSTVELDKLDEISAQWIDSDVLIFNSGQWWIPRKLSRLGVYFQVGKSLKLEMSIEDAFRTALKTWASWIDSMINPERTRVFFRSFEPSHWRCNVTKVPAMKDTEGKKLSPLSDAIFEVVMNMSFPVDVLHVTPMLAYRSDAHLGVWSDNPTISDCSHWCLPGVPDIWNEIVFSYLFGNLTSVANLNLQ